MHTPSISRFLALCLLFQASVIFGQFKYGKYIGAIHFEGSKTQLAAVLDAFTVQHSVQTDFPEDSMILKVSLGGYSSSEYVTFHYETVTANFEDQIVYLEDPQNDLSAELHVISKGSKVTLEGSVLYRPLQRKGKIRLELKSDEPGAKPAGTGFGLPFLPTLAGEYVGQCGTDQKATFQIQTGREASRDTGRIGLTGYTILGQLGFTDQKDSLCAEMHYANVCFMAAYQKGTYQLFNGSLRIQGNYDTAVCDLVGEGDLNCRFQVARTPTQCTFKRKATPSTPFVSFSQRKFLKVSSEQKKVLPKLLPPKNAELSRTITGDYYGILHHENRDVYQLIKMHTVASSSTNNLHNQNTTYLTASLSTFLGNSWETEAQVVQDFVRRPVYIRPGFVLEGSTTDTFLVVDEWKSGFVRGVWYSKKFGRVGKFELVKEKTELPENISLMNSLDGEYHGPSPETIWQVQILSRVQLLEAGRNTQNVEGHYTIVSDGTRIYARTFESASFDPYTGILNLFSPENSGRIFSGEFLPSGDLKLHWPPSSIFSVGMDDYGPHLFKRVGAFPGVQR